MQVLLIGNNNIYKTNLISNISGEYWISDENEKKDIIKIEAINGVWKAISNNYAKIVNPKYLKLDGGIQIVADYEDTPFVERATLKNYNIYLKKTSPKLGLVSFFKKNLLICKIK